MDEEQFREHLRKLGYGEPKILELEPNMDGEMHTHEFSALGMVVRGQSTIQFEERLVTNDVGEFTEIPAGTIHCERTGPEGVTVLLAIKKRGSIT